MGSGGSGRANRSGVEVARPLLLVGDNTLKWLVIGGGQAVLLIFEGIGGRCHETLEWRRASHPRGQATRRW